MDDLSLHILDVAENCINAEAKNIEILVIENITDNKLIIEINDDGKGMNKDMIEAVKDPFVTTRTERKVGLGIPLLTEAAEMSGGNIKINSEPGCGTQIKAIFQRDNIDRKPLGDLAETIIALILMSKNTEINFKYKIDQREFDFSTKKFKEDLNIEELIDINLLNHLKVIIKQKISQIQ
jgi:anti-sigma regulatory factor (Ser/Thr protein kinase)